MHRKPLPAVCSTFLCEQTLLLQRATCCWFRHFSEKTFLPSCLALAYVHLLSCGDAHFWSIYSTSKRSPWCQGELWSQMLSAPLSSMKPSAEQREGGRKDSELKLKLRWSSFLKSWRYSGPDPKLLEIGLLSFLMLLLPVAALPLHAQELQPWTKAQAVGD